MYNVYSLNYLYNKAICSYIYMSVIAGQTAGPKGLTFFEGTHGYPGGNVGKLIFQKSIF